MCSRIFSALGAAFFLGGCISMQPPPGFLVIERGLHDFKAVSADDARLWVRTFGDPHGGELAFWGDVLKKDFVDGRGYTPIAEGTATDGCGRKGIEYVFEVTAYGAVRRYLVALFVIEGWCWYDNTICVAEFTAEKKLFEEYAPAVRAALATLKP